LKKIIEEYLVGLV